MVSVNLLFSCTLQVGLPVHISNDSQADFCLVQITEHNGRLISNLPGMLGMGPIPKWGAISKQKHISVDQVHLIILTF